MKSDIPFGYWKSRGFLRTAPLAYLMRLRRQLSRHNAFRWAVACEINKRRIAAEKEGLNEQEG